MDPEEAARLIVVVDDDESVRVAVQGLLRSAGFPTRAFASAEAYLTSEVRRDAACVIADVQMPGLTGLELQARLAAEGDAVPIIFMTAFDAPQVRARALAAGAVAFLDKPFDDAALIDIVRSISAPPYTQG
jgi:FixJ family two-component response regulator